MGRMFAVTFFVPSESRFAQPLRPACRDDIILTLQIIQGEIIQGRNILI